MTAKWTLHNGAVLLTHPAHVYQTYQCSVRKSYQTESRWYLDSRHETCACSTHTKLFDFHAWQSIPAVVIKYRLQTKTPIYTDLSPVAFSHRMSGSNNGLLAEHSNMVAHVRAVSLPLSPASTLFLLLLFGLLFCFYSAFFFIYCVCK